MTDSPHPKNSSLSLPCTIREPGKEILLGVIQEDLGDRFLVYIPSTNCTNSISKIFVYPDFGKTAKPIPPTIEEAPPSNSSPLKQRRKKGDGTGYIYRRTITRNGKQYPEAYFRYRDETGKLKAKYIPQRLLSMVEEAESRKLPIADILFLLGGGEISRGEHSSTLYVRNNNESDRSDILNRGEQATPLSNNRRRQGEGTGYIECKPIRRGGKEYKQYWYHYEEWQNGDRLMKKSKYIPKRLVSKVHKMETNKVPVIEILEVLKKKY